MDRHQEPSQTRLGADGTVDGRPQSSMSCSPQAKGAYTVLGYSVSLFVQCVDGGWVGDQICSDARHPGRITMKPVW